MSVGDGLRVAIIGSRGIPAKYGGFETFAEELAPRLVVRGHDITVYCRRGYTGQDPPATYRGVRLEYPPFVPIKALETLTHELAAIASSLRRPYDAYYFLGTRGAPWYLLARAAGRPMLVHTDGLEWRRRKWGPLGRAYLKWAEGLVARRLADALVTDAEAMRDYYRRRYGQDSHCIPYGARIVDGANAAALDRWGLEAGGYDLVVCRLEPENNVDLIIREHRASGSSIPLVIVGDVRYEGAYQRNLAAKAGGGVRFLGPVHDGVDDLYAGARLYLHGHEVGGLNPSLLRAMGAATCPFVLDTVFNLEAIGDAGRAWSKKEGALAALLRWADGAAGELEAISTAAEQRAKDRFTWEAAADAHDTVLRGLAGRRRG